MALTLTFSAALWGGVAVVASLLGIYFFRTRSKPQTVGSLLLWAEQRRPSEGGRWLQRPQMPLLLALEIMTVVLIALAAASPRGVSSSQAIPLLVVLDDSYSMKAGGDDSARSQGMRAVEKEIVDHPGYQVRLILAGARPEFLGETCRAVVQIKSLWQGWKCGSPVGELDLGIALARETRDFSARILVITDHQPPEGFSDGRMQWWAFGKARPNFAFINAGRTMFGEKDRFFVELANLSSSPMRVGGQVENGSLRPFSLDIAPRDSRREVFDIDSATSPIRVRLPPDDLTIDDEVVLLPPQQRLVKTSVHLGSGPLQGLVERALAATGFIEAASGPADLLIRGDVGIPALPGLSALPALPGLSERPGQWVMEFQPVFGASSFVGPFAIDRESPLAEGLALEGVIWGSTATGTLPGSPVIFLGNVPLLTEERKAQGGRLFRVSYDVGRSNFHNTTNWPIFFWNLVRWRQSLLPGIPQPNLRLGMEAHLQTIPGQPDAKVTAPDGEILMVKSAGEGAVFLPYTPGIHTVENGSEKFAFAVNCLNKKESDLFQSSSGQWGDWTKSENFRQESLDLSWAFLLPAALLLGIHLLLISAAKGGIRP